MPVRLGIPEISARLADVSSRRVLRPSPTACCSKRRRSAPRGLKVHETRSFKMCSDACGRGSKKIFD